MTLARRLLPWTPVVACLLLVGSHLGCSDSCADAGGPEPEDVHEGTTDLEAGVYESTPWNGTYLPFGPKKKYRFFHGLGGVPLTVLPWVGFDPMPGSVSLGVGDIATVSEVNAESVVVRNNTCETFHLRLVASDPVSE